MPLLLAGCATARLTQTTTLTTPAKLKKSDGVLTQTRQYIDGKTVASAKTVRIEPTQVTPDVVSAALTPAQIALVSNALSRNLCLGLGRRFRIVSNDQPADLSVRVVITEVQPTDVPAAAASKVVDVGGAVVRMTTGIPVPVPRLPYGLGSLSVEAVAVTPDGETAAAMAWARGADLLTVKPRMSEEGDAYFLAKEFGSDYSRLLVTGHDPMTLAAVEVPSLQGVSEFLGGQPKNKVCERFGRKPGVTNAVGRSLGFPPSWTDDGATGL